MVAPSSKWKDVYLCQWHDHPGGVAFASYWLNVLHDSRSFCKKWSEVRAPARQSSTRVYNHQQTLHACNITLAKPVAGFNNTIRVLESTSNNWLSRTQVTTLILLFQPQGRFDTVLAASPWQDRPPGTPFQHRYAAVIWYPRSVVIWKLNCLPGRITSTLVTVSSCKSGRTELLESSSSSSQLPRVRRSFHALCPLYPIILQLSRVVFTVLLSLSVCERMNEVQ